MLLVCSTYLRGAWLRPFDPQDTYQEPFFSDASSTITTATMHQTAALPYLKDSSYALLEMPYNNLKRPSPQLSMYLILPDEIHGIAKVEEKLTAELFWQQVSRLRPQKVAVALPRFHVTTEMSLLERLKQMGLVAPFASAADFSAISGVKDLRIFDIVQKVFIDVDEKGTEAGVATAVTLATKSLDLQQPVSFDADHPFMFVIADKGSQAILFIGRVFNPTIGLTFSGGGG
jgi:serpin B